MSRKRWRMPPRIKAALDEAGLEWTAEAGTKHIHVKVGGELVCVLGMGPADESPGRGQNAIAAIRRFARQRGQVLDAVPAFPERAIR